MSPFGRRATALATLVAFFFLTTLAVVFVTPGVLLGLRFALGAAVVALVAAACSPSPTRRAFAVGTLATFVALETLFHSPVYYNDHSPYAIAKSFYWIVKPWRAGWSLPATLTTAAPGRFVVYDSAALFRTAATETLAAWIALAVGLAAARRAETRIARERAAGERPRSSGVGRGDVALLTLGAVCWALTAAAASPSNAKSLAPIIHWAFAVWASGLALIAASATSRAGVFAAAALAATLAFLHLAFPVPSYVDQSPGLAFATLDAVWNLRGGATGVGRLGPIVMTLHAVDDGGFLVLAAGFGLPAGLVAACVARRTNERSDQQDC